MKMNDEKEVKVQSIESKMELIRFLFRTYSTYETLLVLLHYVYVSGWG